MCLIGGTGVAATPSGGDLFGVGLFGGGLSGGGRFGGRAAMPRAEDVRPAGAASGGRADRGGSGIDDTVGGDAIGCDNEVTGGPLTKKGACS